MFHIEDISSLPQKEKDQRRLKILYTVIPPHSLTIINPYTPPENPTATR